MDQEKTDGALLGEFVDAKAPAAFEELLRRHGKLVLAACRRILGQAQDAEDAAQATFLTLVAKAHSLRGRASVAGWLYHVACNLARNARGAALVRRRHEQEAGTMRANRSDDQQAWNELNPLLDEELNALPPKYRDPLILHYLAGNSPQQTAALTNCKPSACSMRLARGRELLKERLARRGVVLSVGLLSDLMTAHGTAAELSPAWCNTTASAAATVAGASAAAGAIAPAVAALMKGALQTMFIAQIKTAALVLLVASVIGAGLGITAWQAIAADKPDATKTSDNAEKSPVAAKLYDQARFDRAPAVVRVKLLLAGEAQGGAKGGVHLFDDVQVLQVLKGDALKSGQTISIGHHMSKKGVPAGESTAYIDFYNGVQSQPQAWQLLGDGAEEGISDVQQTGGEGKPLTVVQADSGKTFSVAVGQILEVVLASPQKDCGWEVSDDAKPVLKQVAAEFTHQEGADKAIGTYVFRYQAIKEGQAKLDIKYLTPGGPPGARPLRGATGIVAEFAATIKVSAQEQPAATGNASAQFLGAEDQWPQCRVRLDDIHGLWGGMAVEVKGAGDCTVRIVAAGHKEQRFAFKLTADEALAFRQLCVENDLVALKIKERTGLPDEGRPQLSLGNAAGQTHRLQKWSSDKVPAFGNVEAALRALRKKTEGQTPVYEGPYQP